MVLSRESVLHRRREATGVAVGRVLAGEDYYAEVAAQVRALETPVQAFLDAHADMPEDARDAEIRESLVRAAVQRHNRAALEGRLPTLPEGEAVRDIFARLRRSHGILASLIEDAPTTGITDIFINGPDLPLWVERHGRLERLDLALSQEEINGYVEKWIGTTQHPLNAVNWRVTARRPGVRITLIHEHVALRGPVIAIRVHPPLPLSGLELVERGMMPPAAWEYLCALFVHGAANTVVGGPMGSGKTTLMQALLGALGPTCRIATIETTNELLLGPHVVQLECQPGQPGDTLHRGEVTQRALVQESLRLGVQRVVVGECRGAEAFDMLAAMSMGHDGSVTTVHGATPSEALNRLVLLCIFADKPAEVAYELIAQAVHLALVVEKRPEGRRLTAVSEVRGRVGTNWVLSDILVWEDGRLCRTSYPVSDRLRLRVEATGARLPSLDALPPARMHGGGKPQSEAQGEARMRAGADSRGRP